MKPLRKRRVGNLDILESAGDPKLVTIILLHGFGANGYDLASLSSLYPEASWIFPHAPHRLPFTEEGRAWFPVDIPRLSQAMREKRFDEVSKSFPPEISEARATLETLIHALNVPKEKIILGGFSQGAVLATETLLSSSQKMQGLLIFSGTLINESGWRKQAVHHAHTPFFQSHGSLDPLLPLQKAEELETLLLTGGLQGKLHSFHGGHEIPPLILQRTSTFLKDLFATPNSK